MSTERDRDLSLEIGHVLFIDIVGYSKLLINEQSDVLEHLNGMVRGSENVRAAEAEGKLIRLPTGDGMALVFRGAPEAPVRCAVELSRAIKRRPELRVRMGIHSGPINEVKDVNDRTNVAGAGINAVVTSLRPCRAAAPSRCRRHRTSGRRRGGLSRRDR